MEDNSLPPEFPRLPPKPAHSLPPKPAPFNHQLTGSNIVSTDSIDISIVDRETTNDKPAVMTSPTMTQLNYAQLDLNRNESPLSPPHSVTGEIFTNLNISRRNTLENDVICGTVCPQEYAVIDFDRTNALNDVAKLQSQRSLEAGIAVGVRKTRHH